MKIALLLTGQLRTYDMLKYLHYHAIIKKYDTDVFLSIDQDNSLQHEYKNPTGKTNSEKIQNAIDFFQPMGVFVNKNNDYDNEFNRIKQEIDPIIASHFPIDNFQVIFQQYFVVKQAYTMLIQHIHETKKEYDLIVRLRFDQLLWTDETDCIINTLYSKGGVAFSNHNIRIMRILMEKKNPTIAFPILKDNQLHLLGFGDFHHYTYANDQFFYHSPYLLHVMSSFYDSLPRLINECKSNFPNKGCIIEHLFYRFLMKKNISLQKTDIKGIFVREL